MRTAVLVVACALAVSICGCAWVENFLSPQVQQELVNQAQNAYTVAESYAVRYEQERLFWREKISAGAPDNATLAKWLQYEAKAWEKAQYYRQAAADVQQAVAEYETSLETAEGPGDVIAALGAAAQKATAGTPYALPVLVLTWIMTAAWGVYERRGKAARQSAVNTMVKATKAEGAVPVATAAKALAKGTPGAAVLSATVKALDANIL